jgi:hypothetical protein
MQTLLLNKNLLYFFAALLFFQISYSAKAAEITLLNQKEISINDSIEFVDLDILLELLKANAEVERIVFISSHSGYPLRGFDVSDLIIDFELDTHILEACSGECIAAFLGGNKRIGERC